MIKLETKIGFNKYQIEIQDQYKIVNKKGKTYKKAKLGKINWNTCVEIIANIKTEKSEKEIALHIPLPMFYTKYENKETEILKNQIKEAWYKKHKKKVKSHIKNQIKQHKEKQGENK